ncbi:MAG: lysylphosphatidylglycerol synthase transmembrane domain-containing protein [Planctomycetia bacterium]|nr:lysylphosphatidylglycerol synthase transmembrane domain-containing protein [Planctomycetia bacterium]
MMDRWKNKRLLQTVVLLGQVALVVLLFVAIWGTLQKAWTQIASSEFVISWSGPGMVLAAVAYGLCLPFPATYWYFALRHLGQRPTWYRAVRAHLCGHAGKYIPGKIFVVLIRAGLLKGKNVDTTVCVLSIFLEGLLQMAVGAFLVTAVLLWWTLHTGQTRLIPWAVGLFFVVAIPILPPVFKRIVKFLGVKKFSTEVNKVDQLPWKTFLWGIPLMLGFWTLLGLSYWGTIRGIGVPIPISEFPICLAVMAGAMVAGFVFVFMPAGLGVREMLLTGLLTPVLAGYTPNPEAAALVAAAVLRIEWLLVELVLAGSVYGFPGQKENAGAPGCHGSGDSLK